MMKISNNFKIFLTIRMVMAMISWGSFVPDETWQSVEIAHKLVFGYGHLTWEWVEGIRSYLHPCFFAIIFCILKWTALDFTDVVVITPRLLQGFLSAFGDVCMVRVFVKMFGQDKKDIFMMLYASNWFMLYCSSRTLINTFETSLSNIALSLYLNQNPFYVSLIALSFMTRPTTALLWVPLVLHDILFRTPVKVLCLKMIPLALSSVLSVIALDSWFYGEITIVPWNFLIINLLQNISEQYGIHPWHWYLSNFMPALYCGIGLFPLIRGLYIGVKDHSKLLVFSVLFSLFSYSVLGHKEHRFVMPLIPLMLAHMALSLPKKITNYMKIFCFANVFLALYLSLWHQSGPQYVMNYLSSKAKNSSGILILTPCHGTPYYSHLHLPIQMRILECLPNLNEDNLTYQEEDKIFFENPHKWLQLNIDISHYDHLVLYEGLIEHVETYLEVNSFLLCRKFWHTHFPDVRTSQYILIYCR